MSITTLILSIMPILVVAIIIIGVAVFLLRRNTRNKCTQEGVCPNCGKAIKEGKKFCSNCGTKVEG